MLLMTADGERLRAARRDAPDRRLEQRLAPVRLATIDALGITREELDGLFPE